MVGLGLIGGSAAAALRRAGLRVVGHDADPAVAQRALDLELVDAVAGLDRSVNGAGLILLATPLGATVHLLPWVDALAGDDAVIVDTVSVKEPVMQVAAGLPGAERIIGGHPIAGKEVAGPEHAEPLLFQQRTFVLTPLPHTRPAALDRATRMVRALGAIPRRLSAAEHDRILARTSHLPQLLATALALSLQEGEAALGGTGLQDMTRLARSSPVLWQEIFLANAANVLQAAEVLQRQLADLMALIDARDAAGVAEAMERGAEATGEGWT